MLSPDLQSWVTVHMCPHTHTCTHAHASPDVFDFLKLLSVQPKQPFPAVLAPFLSLWWNSLTKSNFLGERSYTAYSARSPFITEGSRGRNLKHKTWRNTAWWFSHELLLIYHSYPAQKRLPMERCSSQSPGPFYISWLSRQPPTDRQTFNWVCPSWWF